MNRWALALTATLASSLALAGFSVSAAAPASPADATPQQWIERMQSAAASLSFSGTFVHQQDSGLMTSRIAQFSDGRQVTTRLQALEGHRQEIVRTPSETRIYMPDRQAIKLDQTEHRRPVFPSMFTAGAERVMSNYDITLGASSRIADVDTQEIFFKPRHADRWPMRVWVDKRTSLPVKCQKLDGQGRAIEQLAFTELKLQGKPLTAAVLAPASSGMKEWKKHDITMRSVADVRLKYKPETLKGFDVIGVYQRSGEPHSGMPFETRRYVLTDGIALVSVFVQPKPLAGSASMDKLRRKGGQSMLSRETADAWITVIGDLPPEGLGPFAQSIEWK